MKRFRVVPGTVEGDRAILRDEAFRHVRKVCRMGLGDGLVLFDGTGMEYEGAIAGVGLSSLEIRIERACPAVDARGADVWLGQGLPKSAKMDLIVQKATEMGAARILPFTSSRTVPRPAGAEEGGDPFPKVVRWRKVAAEAARQCGRSEIPRVDDVRPLDEVIESGRDRGLSLVLWEGGAEEGARRLKEVLPGWDGSGGIVLLVGPEGGFTDEEVVRAEKKAYIRVTLGRRTLRTETTSIAMLAILQYVLGDMG